VAFHIRNGRSIERELGRLARDEFRTALEQLGESHPDEEAIHDARKSLKKIRAVLRLVEPALGSEYRDQNEQLRAAAHSLGALRDADVTAATIEALQGRYSTVITESMARQVEGNLRRRHRGLETREPRLVNRATPVLRRLQEQTPQDIREAARFKIVRRAVRDGYRRARKALADVQLDSDAALVHLFRRRVKNHWYQMRLLECIHPTPRRRARTLRQLDAHLGDDHNLALLRAALLEGGSDIAPAETSALLLGCIDKRQTTLRKRALKVAGRLLRRRPKDFDRSLRRWWRDRA